MIPRTLLPVAASLALSLPAAALAGEAGPPATAGPTTIEIAVTADGFTPARVTARRGRPVRLVVTRTTARTCATAVVVKDLGIERQLPLGKPVVVEFTPGQAGEIRFACPMDMIAGAVVVE